MKKFYTLAAAAVLAMGASAQTLYICGAGDGIDWTPDAPMEVAQTNGNYTFTITNLVQFKMSTAFGDWETFNTAAVGCTVSEETLGTPIALEPSGNNILMPWEGDYTIVVAGDLSTATFTTTTPNPGGFKHVYLRGGMNGWGSPDEWEMTTTDGLTYWFDCVEPNTIPAGTEFKIADSAWGAINYGAAGEVMIDDEFSTEWAYNGNNSVMPADYAGTIKAIFNPEDSNFIEVYCFPTIVEHNDAGVKGITVDNNAPVVYYNLQGVQVANPENGLFIRCQGNTAVKVLVK